MVRERNMRKYLRAGRADTPKHTFWELALSDSDSVRRRLALNPECPRELLRVLATDASHEVRIAVARNRNTPPDVFERLTANGSPDVRFAMASDVHTAPELLEKLAHDDNPYVKNRARRTLSRAALEHGEIRSPDGTAGRGGKASTEKGR